MYVQSRTKCIAAAVLLSVVSKAANGPRLGLGAHKESLHSV